MRPLLLLFTLACATGPTEVDPPSTAIDVTADDEDMRQAVDKAALTLPAFVQRLTQPPPTQTHVALKGRFEENGQVEHLWLSQVTVEENGFKGTIDNDPLTLKGVHAGTQVSLATDHVSDWMAIDDGVLVGGFSIRLLRNRMSNSERASFDHSVDFVVE